MYSCDISNKSNTRSFWFGATFCKIGCCHQPSYLHFQQQGCKLNFRNTYHGYSITNNKNLGVQVLIEVRPRILFSDHRSKYYPKSTGSEGYKKEKEKRN